ncbi:MAG TPA: 30S ribosomal protein S6 [bacterium]|nr:30S ribosomal protein S6 [bacterium]HOL34704.1 30S ribosomal protein S6 [bacterium]
MPRKYEVCLLLDPELDQNGLNEEISVISQVISSSGANLVHSELWGRRSLMYPIKKKKEGYYYLFYFECNPQELKKIEEGFKHREKILRTLVIAKKEFPEFVKNGKSES